MTPVQSKLAQVQECLVAGRLEQARSLSTRLAQAHPKDAGVNAMQSVVLSRLGLYDQAIFFAQRAADLLPHEPELRVRLGQVLSMAGRLADAVPHLEQAVRQAPGLAEARGSLVGALVGLQRIEDAVEVGRAGLPSDDPNLVAFVANSLLNSSRIEECVALYRQAAARHARDVRTLSNLANALNYCPGVTRDEVFEAHAVFGRVLESSIAPLPAVIVPSLEGRALRVGLLSPDLRKHSVAYFIEPWLAHHDRAKFEVHVYSTSRVADDMTRRLRPLAASWHADDASGDRELAERIRRDKIDVLVELSGHTVSARLGVLAHRPAPVQVTYLGYPHTTGLSRIDARLVDSITDPPGEGEPFATERLVRLDPCFVCFSPPESSPPVELGPIGRGAPVTFGSFNSAQKINGPLIELWAALLGRLAGSRLVLKATNFADVRLRGEIVRRFAQAGADPSRVVALPPLSATGDHLASYAGIDIALDPFPYHGTTTTCEALWMGVPVVSLVGDTHAGRVGATLLEQVGLQDLGVPTRERYLETAIALAGNPERLAELRSSLRDRMRASPLCDGAGFAKRFGSCLLDLARQAASRATPA